MTLTKNLAAFIAFAMILFATLGVSGCSSSEGDHAHKYSCSMHPDVVQDKAGKCPKCGMDLTEKH